MSHLTAQPVPHTEYEGPAHLMGPARRGPGRPDPGRPRHLRRQHRAPDHRTRPAASTAARLQWLVTAYLMMSGGGLLLGGRVADLLSRERVFLTGLTLFTIASLVSGFADNGGQLIAARAVQGLSAALLTPSALSLIMTTYAGAQRKTGAGPVGCCRQPRRRRRRPPRRRPHHLGRLAVHLLDQRPHRRSSPCSSDARSSPSRPRRGPACTRLRPARSRHRHRRPRHPHLRPRRHRHARLVVRPDRGRARRLRRPAGGLPQLEQRAANPLFPPHIWKLKPSSPAPPSCSASPASSSAPCSSPPSSCRPSSATPPCETGLAFLPFALAITVGTVVARHLLGHVSPRGIATVGLLITAAGAVLLSTATSSAHYATEVLPGLARHRPRRRHGLRARLGHLDGRHPASHAGVASGFLMTGHEVGAALGVAVLSAVASSAGRLEHPARRRRRRFSRGFVGAAAIGAAFAVFALLRMPASRVGAGRRGPPTRCT